MKRRQFLNSTVATATLAAMPGLVAGKPQDTGGEILRIGFIGTGRHGRNHVRIAAGICGLGPDKLSIKFLTKFHLGDLRNEI